MVDPVTAADMGVYRRPLPARSPEENELLGIICNRVREIGSDEWRFFHYPGVFTRAEMLKLLAKWRAIIASEATHG